MVGDFKLDSGRSRDAADPNSAINMWFNTAAFALPALGTDGNSQRRLVDNPGVKTVDLGLFRDFRFGKAALQVRAEATNVLNTVNLNAPAASLATPATFGKISGAGNMREVQLGAKISF